jgi:hypothetical protein
VNRKYEVRRQRRSVSVEPLAVPGWGAIVSQSSDVDADISHARETNPSPRSVPASTYRAGRTTAASAGRGCGLERVHVLGQLVSTGIDDFNFSDLVNLGGKGKPDQKKRSNNRWNGVEDRHCSDVLTFSTWCKC